LLLDGKFSFAMRLANGKWVRG